MSKTSKVIWKSFWNWLYDSHTLFFVSFFITFMYSYTDFRDIFRNVKNNSYFMLYYMFFLNHHLSSYWTKVFVVVAKLVDLSCCAFQETTLIQKTIGSRITLNSSFIFVLVIRRVMVSVISNWWDFLRYAGELRLSCIHKLG